MQFFIAGVVVVVSLASNAFAAGVNYAELLRCHDRYSQRLGENHAAVVCRGVQSATATAVDDCVFGLLDATSEAAIATICQGIRHDIATATLRCFETAQGFTDVQNAATLCQRTSYRVYTSKINCFDAARATMGDSAAVQLCGGIQD